MHRLQDVGWTLGLVGSFLLWPAVRWLAKRRRWPLERIRHWFCIALCGVLGLLFVPELLTHPGEALLALAVPILVWLPLYLLAARRGVSMKPLQKWLALAWTVLLPIAFFTEGRPLLNRVANVGFVSAMVLSRGSNIVMRLRLSAPEGPKYALRFPKGCV